jgi:hypothetical protein
MAKSSCQNVPAQQAPENVIFSKGGKAFIQTAVDIDWRLCNPTRGLHRNRQSFQNHTRLHQNPPLWIMKSQPQDKSRGWRICSGTPGPARHKGAACP